MKLEGYLHEFKILYCQLLVIGITISETYFIETIFNALLESRMILLYKPYLGSCILPPFDALVGKNLHEKSHR
jgi:hypothetical protein